MTILDLIQKETNHTYRRVGRLYRGSCPWCGDGGKGHKSDRFAIYPDKERYKCWQCGQEGNAIQFIKIYKKMEYKEAALYLGYDDKNNHHNNHNHHVHHNHHNYHNQDEPLAAPVELWLEQAWPFLIHCQEALQSTVGNRALTWLQGRGLTPATIRLYGLGYNDHDHYVERTAWGLAPESLPNGKPKGIWLPRGIVIPWLVDKELWGLRIRRPIGDPKYYLIPGGQPAALYNADAITPGNPVALVEGEIDALTICQTAFIAVATGSTHGARKLRWLARLATTSTVLVAYDNDDAGNKAAAYWLDALPNTRRWRPYWSDVNQLQQDGINVAAWLAAGLNTALKETL